MWQRFCSVRSHRCNGHGGEISAPNDNDDNNDNDKDSSGAILPTTTSTTPASPDIALMLPLICSFEIGNGQRAAATLYFVFAFALSFLSYCTLV